MATTPATPSNAGATTAAQWKTAADNAYAAATNADIAQKQAAQSVKYNQNQIAMQNDILNDPTSTAAEKAAAQASIKTYTEKQTQAQVALATATEQKAKAQQSFNEADAQAAKNTDPQAASTSAPASNTPNQPATAYTVTPPDAPTVSSDTKNVTPSDDPSWDAPAEFSGATKSTPADSSDWADPKPFTEPTRGTTKVVENTTGGSSTTIVRGQPIDTPASQSAQQQYNEAEKRQGLYATDPNSTYGQKSLNNALEKGEITQAQYNEIKNLSAEERDAKYNQAVTDKENALAAKNASQLPGPTTVTRTEEPNTTAVTVTEIQPKTAEEATPISGAIPGTNVSTANIDGTTYQTVSNADGTTTYTNENTNTSTTLNDSSVQATSTTVSDSSNPTSPTERGAFTPASTKKFGEDQMSATAAATPINPQKQVDEFDGIDAQVAEQQNLADEAAMRNDANNTNLGLTDAVVNAQTQASRQDQANFNARKDWRVRLSLAGGATYLYKAEDPGILGPLKATDGVIFPYTPAISVAYAAQYDATTLTHTNYKFYTYNSSSVDQITLSCDFTAQDVFEANYLLAVIHFFRSITKMFYGQDENPKNGTPPPLCYLYGLGAFQFDSHPLAVTNFTYSLPTDVDYIRAGEVSAPKSPPATYYTGQLQNMRMSTSGLQPGAGVAPPQFSGAYRVLEPTYVPTKIQISITAVPIMTRNMVSNDFSLKQYATGQLIKGAHTGSGGGFW